MTRPSCYELDSRFWIAWSRRQAVKETGRASLHARVFHWWTRRDSRDGVPESDKGKQH